MANLDIHAAEQEAGFASVAQLRAGLRVILDSVAEGIVVLDLQGKCTFCNAACDRILGYEPGELLGRHFHDLVHHTKPDGSPYPWTECRAHKALLEGSAAHRDDQVNWRKDGTSLAVEHWFYPVHEDGKLVSGVISFVDVTERRNAEERLKQAQSKAESFLDAIPSVIIEIGSDGCIARWNCAAQRVLAVDKSRTLGQRLASCGVRWLDMGLIGQVEAAIEKQQFISQDNLPFEKGGQKCILALEGHTTFSRNGEPEGIILVGADVTARRLQQVQQGHSQKLEAIGQLAAGIAHEINTPTQYVADNVTFVKGAWTSVSEILLAYQSAVDEAQSGCLSAATSERLARAKQAADFEYILQETPAALAQASEGLQRVAKIVRAMKEFSHPDSDQRHAVDLNRAIETTITVARNEWKYVAEVEARLDASLPPVSCFVSDFNQVILNLIVNAAHAIGDVAQEGQKGKITVATQRAGTCVEIAITDTGKGIPEEIRSRVFDPFFTTKEVGKGTGQGLALAHAVIVKKHGGSIWFESEVGKGTTFYVRLPLGESSAEEPCPNTCSS